MITPHLGGSARLSKNGAGSRRALYGVITDHSGRDECPLGDAKYNNNTRGKKKELLYKIEEAVTHSSSSYRIPPKKKEKRQKKKKKKKGFSKSKRQCSSKLVKKTSERVQKWHPKTGESKKARLKTHLAPPLWYQSSRSAQLVLRSLR